MKLVFKENPKFGDEQDVTEQIISIDENIEKLLAEIKRFEVINFYSIKSNLPISLC
jgi:ribosomal protein S25